MKKIKKFLELLLVLASLSFIGCATASNFTSAFGTVGEIARAAGLDEVSTVANAGAAISKTAEDITPENEYYIGRSVAASLLTNYKVYENKKVESYLNNICAVITENSENPNLYNGYHIKILDSKEVNAFSTSGGHIFVTLGMLNCADSEDALAAVIAHEVAHIQLQHGLKAIKSSRFVTAFEQTANAALTVSKGAELASTMDDMVGDVFSEMVENGYSKDQEFDADSMAVKLMADAGYSPLSITVLLKDMEKLQNGSSKGVYKTHPTPEKRIKNVNKTLGKLNPSVEIPEERFKRYAKIMER